MELRTYRFKLNGKPVVVDAHPAQTLLDVLRNTLALTGSKDGCSKGECGACTVLVNGKAVHSCLTIMEQAKGVEVVTIEGLGHDPETEAILRGLAEEGGVQCGYCTPGIVMASKALLARNSSPSVDEVKEALRGNLCRCTGYVKVVRAVSRNRR